MSGVRYARTTFTVDRTRPVQLFRQTLPYPGGAERRANSKIASLTGGSLEISIQADKLALYQAVEGLLEELPTEKLDLSNRNLGDEDVDYLCTGLGTNGTLVELVLDYNRITDRGVRSLASALTRNRSLTQLSLQGNKVDMAGIEALGLMLRQNTTLRTLQLEDNPWERPSVLDERMRREVTRHNQAAVDELRECMRAHIDGEYADARQLAAEIEMVKDDEGLERYLAELDRQGRAEIPPAVLAGLNPVEREDVLAKAELLQDYERERLGGVIREASQRELECHTRVKSAEQLAAANSAQLSAAEARVAELQAELHAAMLDEQFVLEQQVMVERMAAEAKGLQYEMGAARQGAQAKQDRLAAQLAR